jgi:tripartite-type tricarboxylate transporter receptor subunit TctC
VRELQGDITHIHQESLRYKTAADKISEAHRVFEQRKAQFPDVPLFKDTIPGLVLNASNSLFMPPGTPREQVEYYRNLIAPVLQSSEMQQFMEQNLQFISPAELTPEGVRRAITATKQVWMPYIRKIKLEQ